MRFECELTLLKHLACFYVFMGCEINVWAKAPDIGGRHSVNSCLALINTFNNVDVCFVMCPSSHTQMHKVPFGIAIARQCANAPRCTMGPLPSVHYKPVPPQFVWPHRLPADFSFPETQDHHLCNVCVMYAQRSHGKAGCSLYGTWTPGTQVKVTCVTLCSMLTSTPLGAFLCLKIQYFARHHLQDLDKGWEWHANCGKSQWRTCERLWPTIIILGRNPILNWHILTKSCWMYLLCCLVDIALKKNFFFQKNSPKESRVPIWTHLMETMCGGS